MTDTEDNPCAVSQELITVRCLQCGQVTSGNFVTIVECSYCGAMDYHIFRSYISLDEAADHRPSSNNKNVIDEMIDLVQRKTR